MMGALRLRPGATGRSVAERDRDPAATAAMTLDELETWLVHQIAGVYHHGVHRGLGKAPIAAWTEAMARLPDPHRQPQDPDRFLLDFLPFRHRTVQRSGISLFNIIYSDGVLSTFPVGRRQRFIVRYDPRDMSQVYLRDEEGQYWPIPYSDRRLPAVSLSEIQAASRVSRVRARRMARDALRIVGARVLVIDEIHTLLVGGDRQQRIFLNVIRLLANDLEMPLVCTGTPEARRALLTDSGLADRFEAVELPRWRDNLAFRRLLASYGAPLPLRRGSNWIRARFARPS